MKQKIKDYFISLAIVAAIIICSWGQPKPYQTTDVVLAAENRNKTQYCTRDSNRTLEAEKPLRTENEVSQAVVNEIDGAFLEDKEPTISYDPFVITGMSARQLEELAEGKGKALYDMEQTHGVNAVFCLAVGHIESNWSKTANTHNYFGITKAGGGYRAWNSLYDGIMGFGGYINQSMYHGKDIEGIARIYCPPTASKWAADVKATMAGYYSELE